MKPRVAALCALALVTAVTLAEQVVITRLFSAVLAYHFSFLAVSVAMLGTGAAALLLYLRPGWFRTDSPEPLLARWSVLLSATLLVLPFGLVELDFSEIADLSLAFSLNLTAACALAALPPFASGMVVALAIDRYQKALGAVYAFDLIGAGLGALLVVPVLNLGPAPDLLVALGVVAAVAGVLFSVGAKVERRTAIVLSAVGVGVIGLSQVTSILYLHPRYSLPPGTKTVAEHWTPLARHFGFELEQPHFLALLFYDRVYAPVPVVEPDRLPTWQELRTGPASVGFALSGPGRTLIIGGGGGRDIYNALSSGQEQVDVIELLEGNRKVVDEDLGYLSGAPYSRENVHTVIGDGRSVLAGRDTKYDQIHIGFTDTLTANAAQGFALTENNLYTVEAFDAYFDHLTPNGILNVSRLLKLVGDEALRVTVLTLAALERRGVEDPFRHVIVVLGSDILGPPTGTVLAKLTPFTEREVTEARRLAKERADGLLMVPGGPNRLAWQVLAGSESLEAFCSDYRLDVCPPTDDRPFFFNMARLRDLGRLFEAGYQYTASPMAILLLTLGILLVLSLVGLVMPLVLVREAKRPTVGALSYFGAVGLGFLLLEMVFIQRFVLFLGFPTYALSVVLFALLIFSGIGAYISGRVAGKRRALVIALAVATGLIFLSSFALQPALRALIALPFPVRVFLAILLIAPFGVCLGFAMPIGLERLAGLHPRGVPYAWGVNGIASVLASVLGIAVAVELGFLATSLLAAICYLYACLHAAFGRWTMAA